MIWARKNLLRALPPITLQGLRIDMRPPAEEDWQAWIDVRGKNRARLEPFEPRWAEDALTRECFQRRLTMQIEHWQDDLAYSFLIFDKQNNLIGGMNINNICRGAAQYASLGYWIGQDLEGQGYMAEALTLTINYCFGPLNLHRIHAACLPGNEKSKKLLTRAGFTEEGFAKNYIQINGLWQDHILYGLVKKP